MAANVELPAQALCQGRTNGCGTAALAMALNILQDRKAPGITQAQLDRRHRRLDIFSAPGMLLRAARMLGFAGRTVNRTGLPELRGNLQAGNPVLALHSVDGTIFGLHYLLICGYWAIPGQEGDAVLILLNPASAQNPRREILFSEFTRKYWHPLRYLGLPLGFERLSLVFSRAGDFACPPQADEVLPWILKAADGVGRGLNWMGRLLDK